MKKPLAYDKRTLDVVSRRLRRLKKWCAGWADYPSSDPHGNRTYWLREASGVDRALHAVSCMRKKAKK